MTMENKLQIFGKIKGTTRKRTTPTQTLWMAIKHKVKTMYVYLYSFEMVWQREQRHKTAIVKSNEWSSMVISNCVWHGERFYVYFNTIKAMKRTRMVQKKNNNRRRVNRLIGIFSNEESGKGRIRTIDSMVNVVCVCVCQMQLKSSAFFLKNDSLHFRLIFNGS